MAQQQDQDTPTIGFKSIQLLNDQTLGIGSYGIVCKALCDDLLCAAKIIHLTLFDPNAHQRIDRRREHRLPMRRFMQECEFMSAIRHPNIVQFLGTHEDPQTGLPVLLMELMDDSLTHFLESSEDAVPYHIQVNFCHDITMAISYLHSNGIIHRDLSSNNVLLYGTVKAKVTDFGMAKFGDINPQATPVSFTMCPGTDVYMPPEAVKDPPIYTEKIDCFAIGTLIIQILTRFFPDPAGRQKSVDTTDPRIPDGKVHIPVPEIERRENHIILVDPNHPLLPIALECLNDSDVDRPSAQELCPRVAALKEAPQFIESVRRAQERPEPAATERGEEISQQECQQLRGTIREQQRQLQRVTQQLKSSQQVTNKYQTRIQEIEQQLEGKWPTEKLVEPQTSLRDPPQTPPPMARIATATRDSLTLRWREGKKAPCKLARDSNAVVDGEMVYLRAGKQTIYAYNSRNETWKQLPDCPNSSSSLAVIKGYLVAVGGKVTRFGNQLLGDKVTNKLFSHTREPGDRMSSSTSWRSDTFLSMPTRRAFAITLSIERALIVAGGIDQDKKTLETVEIMNTNTEQWSSAADLLTPLYNASMSICHERVYIVGALNDSKSVYTCSLIDLFQSCKSIPSTFQDQVTQYLVKPLTRSYNIWSRVSSLRVEGFTCVTLYGRLLAIGGNGHANHNIKYQDSEMTEGSTDSFDITSDVQIYHPTSDKWEVISHMSTSRYQCFVAVLSTNELMVVGGHTTDSSDSQTDSVEIGTVI